MNEDNNQIINPIDFNYKNIYFDKISKFYNTYNKIDIYNLNSNQPLQKIWIKIENVKIYSSIYEKNNNSFIVFNNNQSNDIMNFISNLDEEISKYLKDKNLIYKKSIINKIPFNIMKINLPKFKFNNSNYLSF